MSRSIEDLAPERVTIDPTVERNLDQRRVAKIAAELRIDAIGVPTVSRRVGGAHIVLDGMHRFAALTVAGLGDVPVPVAVYTGLTLEQEAELFRLLNNTKGLSAADKFRIALVEGDPESQAIDAIVSKNGYTTRAGAPNSAIAVTAMAHIYRRDQGDTLNRTLAVASGAWGHRKHAANQTVLNALAAMLFRYGHTVNLARLAEKLKMDRDGANPSGFLGVMRSLADVAGTTPSDAGAGKLVTIYNRNYHTDSENRLADWK